MRSLPAAEPIARWRLAIVALLALVFLATGLGKLLDIRGFAAVLGDYRIWPMALLPPMAAVITAAELLIGMGVLAPARRRAAALAAALLAAANAALLTLTLWRGIDLPNCGCFGAFLARPLMPWTPLEDVLLIGLAILARGPASRGSRPPTTRRPGGTAPR